ncbi:Uncharacterised protein [Lederbergia lenta]|uniref:Uncharacterized protein n=1 Tax=Lederbergia lenta TaxID=1467 RepID=A0A2X4VNG2_LEDLE|nr:Uncharacterised protein [Lederbergia lenta]
MIQEMTKRSFTDEPEANSRHPNEEGKGLNNMRFIPLRR